MNNTNLAEKIPNRHEINMRTVNISDMQISNSENEALITYSLGSCVGITIYDPVLKIGGMIHSMLPMSKIDPEKAKQNPAMFVDTGLTLLLQNLLKMGAEKSRLIVKVAGAGSPLDKNHVFNIGPRNYAVVRKILWKNNILIKSEDIGGTKARTMSLYINSGMTTIKSGKEVNEL